MGLLTRFLISRLDPRAVPLFKRLANLDAKPSLEVWVAIGVLGTSALIVTLLIIPGNEWWVVAFFLVGFLLFIFSPISGVVAAILTRSDLNKPAARLLALSNLDGRAMYQAYFTGIVWRLRAPLILTFAGLLGLGSGILLRFGPNRLAFLPHVISIWVLPLVTMSMGVELSFYRDPLPTSIALQLVGTIGFTITMMTLWVLAFFISAATVFGNQIFITSLLIWLITLLFSSLPYWMIYFFFSRKRNLPKWVD